MLSLRPLPFNQLSISEPVLSKGSEPLWGEFLLVFIVAYNIRYLQDRPEFNEFMHALEEKESKIKEAEMKKRI